MQVVVSPAPTTGPLPWDAEADDVKYALEALQQVCTVDVERVVETGSNGYAWYVTFTAELESRDDTRFMFSPLPGLGAAPAARAAWYFVLPLLHDV